MTPACETSAAQRAALAFCAACRKDMIKFRTPAKDATMPADPTLRDCWPRKPEFGGACTL